MPNRTADFAEQNGKFCRSTYTDYSITDFLYTERLRKEVNVVGFAQLDTSLVGRVSNNALIVYTLMRDRAVYDSSVRCWELRYKVKTIAEMCNISERCCRDCIAELERCDLLAHDRTGRSSYYIIQAPECCTAPQRLEKVTVIIP